MKKSNNLLKKSILIGLGILSLTTVKLVFEDLEGNKTERKYQGFLSKILDLGD